MRRASKQTEQLRKYITWIASVGVILFFCFLVLKRTPETKTESNSLQTAKLVTKTKTEKQLETDEDNDNDNDAEGETPESLKFHRKLQISKSSDSYTVNPKPKCWNEGCSLPGNRLALKPCHSGLATAWNSLGVESMERYTQGPLKDLEGFNDGSLLDAMYQFKNATSIDPKCVSAKNNLALVLIRFGRYVEAIEELDSILSFEDKRTYIFKAIALEFSGSPLKSHEFIDQYLRDHPDVHKEYFGFVLTTYPTNAMREYDSSLERSVIIDYLLWKEFSSYTLSNYAQISPESQDFFIQNKWIILRKIIPPFPLAAAQKCFHMMIKLGKLQLGDLQSRRYTAYNSRCSSFFHFTFTDLVRKIVSHNAIPSYTYFGGYVSGAGLDPHSDRPQCEFTMSLTIQNHPYNETWILSLGDKAKFERNDDWPGKNPEEMPEADTIRDADLYAGDCLLFMGRHLVHFRRGTLKTGSWINQIFLHYVQEDFKKSLG